MALFTQIDNGGSSAATTCSRTLLLASALAFVSLGQLVVLLTGNFDLSVGPLMGLAVVCTSFFWPTGQGTGELVAGHRAP